MTLLALDPLRDAALHSVIDAQLAVLRQDPANNNVPFEQLRVEAVLAAVSERSGQLRVPEIVLHLDAKTACEGRHEHTLSETIDGVAVPVATVQRFCCEAVVTAVIVDADGTVRNLAEQRTANRHQRRALAAMYSTCAHPHCEVGFSNCRMHHIVWWTRGGQTTLANLLPLCETHHHLVHEGGWNLTMTADRDRHLAPTRRHHLAHPPQPQPTTPTSRQPTQPTTHRARTRAGVDQSTTTPGAPRCLIPKTTPIESSLRTLGRIGVGSGRPPPARRAGRARAARGSPCGVPIAHRRARRWRTSYTLLSVRTL